MAIPAVDDDPGERTEKKRRKLACESHDAEKERGAGQTVDEPIRRRRGDPCSHQRDDLTAEEKSIVAVAERAQHERDGGRRSFEHVLTILVNWARSVPETPLQVHDLSANRRGSIAALCRVSSGRSLDLQARAGERCSRRAGISWATSCVRPNSTEASCASERTAHIWRSIPTTSNTSCRRTISIMSRAPAFGEHWGRSSVKASSPSMAMTGGASGGGPSRTF